MRSGWVPWAFRVRKHSGQEVKQNGNVGSLWVTLIRHASTAS